LLPEDYDGIGIKNFKFGGSYYQTTPWHPLEFASNYLEWPHQLLVVRMITMGFVANFQPHMHEWKPRTIDHKCVVCSYVGTYHHQCHQTCKHITNKTLIGAPYPNLPNLAQT